MCLIALLVLFCLPKVGKMCRTAMAKNSSEWVLSFTGLIVPKLMQNCFISLHSPQILTHYNILEVLFSLFFFWFVNMSAWNIASRPLHALSHLQVERFPDICLIEHFLATLNSFKSTTTLKWLCKTRLITFSIRKAGKRVDFLPRVTFVTSVTV